MLKIIYPYPVAGIIDLKARLTLDSNPVTDWITMNAFTIEDIHGGYSTNFNEVEADNVELYSLSQSHADVRPLPIDSIELTSMSDKVNSIHNKIITPTPVIPNIILPKSTNPNMAVLAVWINEDKAGESVVIEMVESRVVSINGQFNINKTYSGVTNDKGVAFIELFPSTMLRSAGYRGLYKVLSTNINRTVWVPDEGGILQQLPVSSNL